MHTALHCDSQTLNNCAEARFSNSFVQVEFAGLLHKLTTQQISTCLSIVRPLSQFREIRFL